MILFFSELLQSRYNKEKKRRNWKWAESVKKECNGDGKRRGTMEKTERVGEKDWEKRCEKGGIKVIL